MYSRCSRCALKAGSDSSHNKVPKCTGKDKRIETRSRSRTSEINETKENAGIPERLCAVLNIQKFTSELEYLTIKIHLKFH